MNDLIAHPHVLWLLGLLPLLAVALRFSLARMTPLQARACLALRALILALLVLALAGFRLPWQSHDLAVVFAFDRSASVTPEAEKAGREFLSKALSHRGRGDDAALLGFAGEVAALPDLAASPEGSPWPAFPDRNATDTAKALAFSAAVFPEGKTRRLVLLSDGYDTGGHASSQTQTQSRAQALRASGVELFTVPLQNPFRPEALVERLELPAKLRQGEPFDATAVVRSNVAGQANQTTVRLYANGFVAGEQTVPLKAGDNPVVFRNLRPGKNTSTYEVEITPERDTLAENNRAQATVLQRGEPRLLVVDPSPERIEPLKGALAAEHIVAEVRPLQGLPATMEDLQGYDALFLSDVSALHLSRDQMQLYARWVKDFGGGFAMLGGENSFGVGGYFKTPIETILPVKTEHDDRTEAPSVAVMIVLDSSGSMSAQVAGQTKMSLANQGAALALDVLQPKDFFGVMAVDSKVHQVVPLAPHGNKGEVANNILRVTAGGGGIYIYTSLLESFAQLRETSAKIKHIILFSDAADAEEKASGEMPDGSQVPGTALDLVSAMATGRITTSVVALGNASDKDVAFLKQLAANGNGRFYLTSDALTLPQIFSTETMRVAQSSLVEEPVAAVAVRRGPVLEGINWEQSPLLLGYNLTKLKPTADLLLATERGDPLLATWRFGLGRVAAFTSDAKSRWASEWLAWPGYGKFWAQLTRSLLRRTGGSSGAGGLHLESTAEGDRLKVRIDAVAPDGSFRNQLPLTLGAVRPDGSQSTAEARQVAPGRYEASVAVSGTGTTWVNVHSPDLPEGGALFGHTPSYPAEFLNNGTDENALARLAEVAGGAFAPKPEAIFARPANGVLRHTDLSNYFLAAALLLLPLDIWLRRRAWAGGESR